jgi:UDP-glucuronate decarboxylase
MRHDVTFPLYVEVDEIYNLACPASPVHYQFDPVQTTKTSVHGAINMLGLAKRLKAKDPAGLDQRGLRRPGGASADRGLLGQRQPDRAARLLRRGQALRRDAVLRLPPPARLRIKVARIFNTYGPRMHPNDGRVVSNFIVQALRASRSPSTARARRRAPSATWTTWSTG